MVVNAGCRLVVDGRFHSGITKILARFVGREDQVDILGRLDLVSLGSTRPVVSTDLVSPVEGIFVVRLSGPNATVNAALQIFDRQAFDHEEFLLDLLYCLWLGRDGVTVDYRLLRAGFFLPRSTLNNLIWCRCRWLTLRLGRGCGRRRRASATQSANQPYPLEPRIMEAGHCSCTAGFCFVVDKSAVTFGDQKNAFNVVCCVLGEMILEVDDVRRRRQVAYP